MNIDEMPAGREMDALIAEKVMEFRVYNNPSEYSKPFILILLDGESDQPPFHAGQTVEIPHYSLDIGDAWDVVNKLNQLGFNVQVDARGNHACARVWSKRMTEYGPYPVSADAKTAPLAICRAALKAIDDAHT